MITQNARGNYDEEANRPLSRRNLLRGGSLVAAALLAATVAGAQQRANTRQAEHDRSASDPGPENRPLLKRNPSSTTPPPTDEWAIMLNGNARVSVLNPDRTVSLDDVAKGDPLVFSHRLSAFHPGTRHSARLRSGGARGLRRSTEFLPYGVVRRGRRPLSGPVQPHR